MTLDGSQREWRPCPRNEHLWNDNNGGLRRKVLKPIFKAIYNGYLLAPSPHCLLWLFGPKFVIFLPSESPNYTKKPYGVCEGTWILLSVSCCNSTQYQDVSMNKNTLMNEGEFCPQYLSNETFCGCTLCYSCTWAMLDWFRKRHLEYSSSVQCIAGTHKAKGSIPKPRKRKYIEVPLLEGVVCLILKQFGLYLGKVQILLPAVFTR